MTSPNRLSSLKPVSRGKVAKTCLLSALGALATAGVAKADAPSVVTSIKPLHSIASAVMEGVGEPFVLIDGAASPHGFALKPSQAFLLQGADVVFWVGPGLTSSLAKPISSMAGDASVELMKAPGIEHLGLREGATFDAHDHDHGDHGEEHAHDDHGHDDHDKEEHAHDDHGHDDHDKEEHAHDDHAHDDHDKEEHAHDDHGHDDHDKEEHAHDDHGHDDHDKEKHAHDDHDHDDHDKEKHAHDDHGHDDHDEEEHAHDDHGHDDHDKEEHAHDDHGHDDHAHGEGAQDAHIWLNPDNGIAIAGAMAETLAKIDPDNADTYRANAEKFAHRIEDLEKEISAKLKPVSGKKFIVFHDAYHHFEHHFDVEASGSVTLTPETISSADRLAKVQDTIQDLEVTCVFQEPQFDSKLVKVAIEGSSARIGTLDPLGAELGNGVDLYPDLLTNLANNLADCLGNE